MNSLATLVLAAPILSPLLVFGALNLRNKKKSGAIHWGTYVVMGILATLLSQSVGPLVIRASQDFMGKFNFFSLSGGREPPWTIFVVSILLIDFGNYCLHRLMHTKFLWRAHRVHHSDRDISALTVMLHHPIEVILSTLLLMLFYLALDMPIVAVLAYVLIFSVYDALLHSHLKINKKFESCLGLVLVTPSLHRSHHSKNVAISNTNFGSLLSIWDRLLGSYRHKANVKALGIEEFSSRRSSLRHLLGMPFTKASR
jgi:sterol desaturase/sphingolipid hydroxylase (fatty acid hydroxylase superfamily)